MSDQNNIPPEYPNYGAGGAVAPPAPVENVARGLAFALLAIIGGIALTVIIWRLGFVASITSFALAAGAVFLYARGAGAAPRRGIIPLVLLIVVGVVVAFFGVMLSDAWELYDKLAVAGAESRMTFLWDYVRDGETVKSYGKDMAWFGAFAVFGIFSIMRRLVSTP